MLNIARSSRHSTSPLIGINQGRLGFLTDIALDTMMETDRRDARRQLCDRGAACCSRPTCSTAGERMFDVLAFNDVVVTAGVKGGMIEFEVSDRRQFVCDAARRRRSSSRRRPGRPPTRCRAGGPIMHPSLSAMALVPICAAHAFQPADRDQQRQRSRDHRQQRR